MKVNSFSHSLMGQDFGTRQATETTGNRSVQDNQAAAAPRFAGEVASRRRGMSLLGGLMIMAAPFVAAGQPQPAQAGEGKNEPRLVREENLEKMLKLGQEKLTGLQESKDQKEVRLDKARKNNIAKHMKPIYDLMEEIKDKAAVDSRSPEVTRLLNKLRHTVIANPEERTETQRWSNNTVRIASCGQEELAGFYKTVVPMTLSLEKDEIRNLYQALADVHRTDTKASPSQPWPNDAITQMFGMLTGFKTKLVGTQTQLASTNFQELGNVWSRDNNKAMQGKRKVAIFYNHEENFRPELIGFIKKMSELYDLSFGDYKPEDVDDLVNQTESAVMGDFIILCPKGKLASRRIEKVFDDLQAFSKKVPDAEVMVYVGAHGSYDGAHAGQDDVSILEGARIGVSHFKDADVNEHFWMEQSKKLDGFKNRVPWFFDTCHSGSMLSKDTPRPDWDAAQSDMPVREALSRREYV